MSDEIQDMKDDGAITDDDKLWAALSLAIGIIGVILLFVDSKKDRPFIRYAAIHGAAVFVIQVILAVIPVLNCVTGIISIVLFIYMVYLAITETFNGKYVEVPYLTDFLKGQGWL